MGSVKLLNTSNILAGILSLILSIGFLADRHHQINRHDIRYGCLYRQSCVRRQYNFANACKFPIRSFLHSLFTGFISRLIFFETIVKVAFSTNKKIFRYIELYLFETLFVLQRRRYSELPVAPIG